MKQVDTQMNALMDAKSDENVWHSRSWQRKRNRFMPVYLPQDVDPIVAQLSVEAGLVNYQEVKRLRHSMATVHSTGAFVIQAGNTDEQLKDTGDEWVCQQTRLLNTLVKYLIFASGRPVLPIGIIGGNYARMVKQPVEQVGGASVFSFYGDMVNQCSPSLWERRPDAKRLIWSYEAAKKALAGVERFAIESFVSHMGANLYYEQSLVRKDEQTQSQFAASTHMLWLEASHIYAESSYLEFCRGIVNPIGIRLQPELTVKQIVDACQQLNPDREQGKLVLMIGAGVEQKSEWLEELILAVKKVRQPVIWLYDPLFSSDVPVVVNPTEHCRELKQVMAIHERLDSRLHGLFLPCANLPTEPMHGSRNPLPVLSFEQALQLCSHLVFSELGRR